MHLLQIIRTLNPETGGPAEGLLQMTLHLSALGVKSTLVSFDPPSASWLQNHEFDVIGIGRSSNGYGFSRSILTSLCHIAIGYDALIVHGLWQYQSCATWLLHQKLGIPYYVYPHGMLDPWFKNAYPLRHIKKSFYWRLVESKVLREASAVLFTTDEERRLARLSFGQYTVNEVVAGYGTSLPPSDSFSQVSSFFATYPALRNCRLFLFMGRIHPKKGLDLLIKSFATLAGTHQDLHLVIAGPDSVGWKHELELLIDGLNLTSRITWTGMLYGELKWGAFRAAELFCLPSFQENFGIAVAESLACSLPVCISTAVNISSYVTEANAGIVHSPSVASTTVALSQWLSLSAAQRDAMKRSSFELFETHFNLEHLSSSLLSILSSYP